MATIRQLMQTTVAEATEILGRLPQTSNTAVKTRELLLRKLKKEIKLIAAVDKLLMPALRQHRASKVASRRATKQIDQVHKHLAKLESTERDSAVFERRASELRDAVTQHARDSRKQMLPRILDVLTDREARDLVKKIEAEVTSARQAKGGASKPRSEAGQAAAGGRRGRKPSTLPDAVEVLVSGPSADDTLGGLTSAPDSPRGPAAAPQAEDADRTPETTFAKRESQEGDPHAERPNMYTSSNSIAGYMQNASAAYIVTSQRHFQKQLSAFAALSLVRTPAELLVTQGVLLRNSLKLPFIPD
jgi:hypothetical protein